MKTGSYSHAAYDFIRKAILNGAYKPGQALPEAEIAQKSGVSRTPVREALRQLESEGLITIRANAGAKVKAVTLKEYRETTEVRQALEATAAGLAAQNRTDEELEAIRIPLEKLTRATEALVREDHEKPDLVKEVVEEDVRFHLAIILAAGNDLLKKEIMRLHLIQKVVTNMHPEMERLHPAGADKAKRDAWRAESLTFHRNIFEAIRDRDAAKAKRVMEQHLQLVIDLSLLAMARAKNSSRTQGLSPEDMEYLA